MVILRDGCGMTIKATIGDTDHVRIGIFQTALWRGGVSRQIRNNRKPPGEISINDCMDLLGELESLP